MTNQRGLHTILKAPLKGYFMNELLWILLAILNFLALIAIYKYFGLTGLFAWIAMNTVIANIQVTKTVELFGLTATLGNIAYGSIFLATDAISEKYQLKDAKRAVYIGFFSLLFFVVVMQLVLLFGPQEGDVHEAMAVIFGLIPRIALGSIIAYLISQWFDVHLFSYMKNKNPDKKLYLRNLITTSLSQFLDTIIFVPIAFLGVFDTAIVIDILITTYLIKLIVAGLDTPFIYWIKSIQPLNEKSGTV